MTSSGNIHMKCLALTKMLLHAARWGHLAVNGVLLGPSSEAGKDSTNTLVITDAVPLFHQQLALSPMLDVALTQIEQRYSAQGLEIVGYYQANENVKDVVPDFVAKKITEKIAENYDSSCLVMIDNRKVCMELSSSPLIVSQLTQDGKWKNRDNKSVIVDQSSLDTVSDLLRRRVFHEITDFDLHFDDITLDWANTNLNKLMGSYAVA
uniref:ER membrane protein complex subunit 9-like n=2 Tax=Hirondellea gigas TaxID=1518452 RepID=A0A6A7FZ41_9CRUS